MRKNIYLFLFNKRVSDYSSVVNNQPIYRFYVFCRFIIVLFPNASLAITFFLSLCIRQKCLYHTIIPNCKSQMCLRVTKAEPLADTLYAAYAILLKWFVTNQPLPNVCFRGNAPQGCGEIANSCAVINKPYDHGYC